MNRRKFLGQSALLTTGIITMPKLMFAKTNQKYGLQLFSLSEQLLKDVKGVIAKVAEAGYKQVETFGYNKEHGFWGLSAVDFKNSVIKLTVIGLKGLHCDEIKRP